MLGLPIGWAYGHVAEWVLHRYLHKEGKRRDHPLAFHFHEHHGNSRRNHFNDPIYEGSPLRWDGAGKELLGMVGIAAAHLPLAPVAPWFTAAVMASTVQYYRVHKRSHNDPDWARSELPWHYDHHMGPDQDCNYGVRSDWVDRALGTRKPYLGTARAERDEARRRARSEARELNSAA